MKAMREHAATGSEEVVDMDTESTFAHRLTAGSIDLAWVLRSILGVDQELT